MTACWKKIRVGFLLALVAIAIAYEGEMTRVAHHAAFLPSSSSSSPYRSTSRRPAVYAAVGALDNNILSKTDWSPRSRHWVNDDFFQQESAIQLGTDLDESLKDIDANSASSDAVVTSIHRNKDGNAIAVEVASALSEHDVATVRSLSTCIRESHIGKSQFENRSFGDGKGGNDCTYLAPLLQVFRYDVAAKVIDIVRLAWKAGSWEDTGYPDPLSLGIRTSEHLSYNGWRSLEAHKDIGSMYTIMVSIAAPKDYEGGEFFVQNYFYDSTDIKPNRLSAIVFLSDTIHGVRPITSGHRETFVTELWTNDDSPLGMNRPTIEQWENYVDAHESNK